MGSGVGPAGECRAVGFAPNPDQSYVAPGAAAYIIGYASYPNQKVEQAQTFTVGASGYLTGLNVQVTLFDSPPGQTTNDLVISLHTTSGGMPAATSLASVTVPASSVPIGGFINQPAWVSVDLSAFHLSVSQGEQLAVVLDSTSIENGTRGYGWLAGNNAADYPAGSAWGHVVGSSWNQDTFDFGFQDFVSPVPEPSVAALAGVGMLSCCWLRCQRAATRR